MIMDTIIKINNAVNSFAWGTFGLTMLLGAGVLCTVITGCFQLTHIRYWFNKTFGSIKGEARVVNDAGAFSQYRTFCTSLCATVGTGNIAGVASAICVGGAGSIFWMWVAALLGMMVKYSENVLGIYYRRRNVEGAWSGGPMYYLQDGVGALKHCKRFGKVLAVIFCILTIVASFGIGNMIQISKITVNVEETFFAGVDKGTFLGLPKVNLTIGMVLMVAAALIIFGGFRRVSAASEKVIPFMCITYILGCLIVTVMHFQKIPGVFSAIFKFALGADAVKGGAVGTAVQLAINTIQSGCKRGIFSNEAGLGTSVIVHCNTCAREPVKQGLWGMAEVFLDTIVICTMTALVVLSSDAVDLTTGLVLPGTSDATLVSKAFGASFGRPGEWFAVMSLTLFAFSTFIGWSYYGAKVTEYLLGVKIARIYRIIFVAIIIWGSVTESSLAWEISDTFNGLMMIPNLIGVITLSPLIIKLTRNYVDRRIRGKDVEPILSFNPDIQTDAVRAVKKGAY